MAVLTPVFLNALAKGNKSEIDCLNVEMSSSDEIQKFIWEELSSVQTTLIITGLYVNISNMYLSRESAWFTSKRKSLCVLRTKLEQQQGLTNTILTRIAHKKRKKDRNGTIPATCQVLLALVQRTHFLSIGVNAHNYLTKGTMKKQWPSELLEYTSYILLG